MRPNSARCGGVLVWILVTFLLLAALAMVGVFLAGMYLSQNIRVEKTRNAQGESVKVETPIGSMRVQEHKRLDPKMIGVPVYPGSVREDRDGGGASFAFDSEDTHKEFTVLAAEYSTEDSVEKVKDFYRGELPHWMVSKSRHGTFQMEYTEGGYKRFVAITEKQGRTRIALASVGEPAAN